MANDPTTGRPRWDIDHWLNVGLNRVLGAVRWAKGERLTAQLPPDESLGPARPGESRPPWIEYPGLPPYDFFWRDAGQPWFAYRWEPFYISLTPDQQAAYLEHWKVPESWRTAYFDPDWRALGEDDLKMMPPRTAPD